MSAGGLAEAAENRALETLEEVFGFREFRAHQGEIVDAILAGRDVFAVMPTGAGKSLCYQLPAVILEGTAVVVSPLIALMKDQVDGARENGIRAAFFNSTLGAEERGEVMRRLRAGELDLLYLAPERLLMDGFLDRLRAGPLGRPSFFAIDEAHCISEWGHDFRKDYLGLDALRREFPEAPVAAFTATATARVGEDIVGRLALREPFRVRASFNRANLFYEVAEKDGVRDQILEFVRGQGGAPGIVYRGTRKDVETTAADLARAGVRARGYHAGMPDEERTRTQDAFLEGETDVVVATIAFGMGIDKPDVRFVLHGDMPKNLEGYYQETGRAGRDGDPAKCVLFYGRSDVMLQLRFLEAVQDEAERKAALDRLRAMERYALGSSCRRAGLLSYFGERLPEGACTGCDVCADTFEDVDATREARIFLSAVARTGERFGTGHLVDIVTGKETPRVRQFGHDKLKTFGAGRDIAADHWRALSLALLAAEVVEAEGRFGSLLLTPRAWRVMKGEEPFVRRRRKERPRPVSRSGRGAAAEVEVRHPDLMARLRQWRLETARAEAVPPYIIAHDRMLREVCARLPRTIQDLRQVAGFGERKAEMFGGAITGLVAGFLEEHPEARAEAPRVELERAGPRSVRPTALTDTIRETLRLVRAGMTLSEAAAERGMSTTTLVAHIDQAAECGERADLGRVVDMAEVERLRPFFEKHGMARLKPVVEEAGGLEYDTARLARAALRMGGAEGGRPGD